MKVLFIGGTGNISTACSELALSSGIDLYILNRGSQQATGLEVNFIAYTPAEVERG